MEAAQCKLMAQFISSFFCLLTKNDGRSIEYVITYFRDEFVPDKHKALWDNTFLAVCDSEGVEFYPRRVENGK